MCALLARRLHEPVTLAMLGWDSGSGAVFVPADDGLGHAWNPAGAIASLREALEADGMDRRHFIAITGTTGTTLTTFAHDWLLEPARIAAAVQGKRIDQVVVDELRQLCLSSRKLDEAVGGGVAVFRTVREHLRLAPEILDNATYTEQVGKGLYAVAAEFAQLAGWLAYDLNQHAIAQRFYIAGLRAAHSSGDQAIGANILAFMGQQARYADPRDAVRLAESGLLGAKQLSPAVAARMHGRLAETAASAGDAVAANRAIEAMFNHHATIDPAVEPPWIYWWDTAETHYLAGQTALALDDPRRAEAHYRDALVQLDPAYPRTRGRLLPQLAMARLRMGELEGACRAAAEAGTIGRKLGSERVRTRLIEFRRAAAPYANTQALKHFDAKFADLFMRP
ncbi:MAG TPA: hypothetical protein VFM37_10090 [Pseudonocardiaceae bacterium]|nr:hypothetical protein [Pseudonocardiaceae bacterium]